MKLGELKPAKGATAKACADAVMVLVTEKPLDVDTKGKVHALELVVKSALKVGKCLFIDVYPKEDTLVATPKTL
jgi:hypothetical protein